jgi:integrase
MSGSIREKRPGVWELRVFVGRDPVTRKFRYSSRSVSGTKREAQRVLNEMAVDADRGLYTGTGTPFRLLVEKWLELAKNDLSPSTIRRYRYLLNRSYA